MKSAFSSRIVQDKSLEIYILKIQNNNGLLYVLAFLVVTLVKMCRERLPPCWANMENVI